MTESYAYFWFTYAGNRTNQNSSKTYKPVLRLLFFFFRKMAPVIFYGSSMRLR